MHCLTIVEGCSIISSGQYSSGAGAWFRVVYYLQDDGEMHELAVWVKRQRMLWQQGNLVQDRMTILSALGFEVGTEAQITEEWEYRFDQLVEWLILAVRS